MDDLSITEQEIADYGSKYRDLQPTVKLYKEEGVKESILNEINSEIDLPQSEIDVDYITELLKNVGADVENKEKLKESFTTAFNDVKLQYKNRLEDLLKSSWFT